MKLNQQTIGWLAIAAIILFTAFSPLSKGIFISDTGSNREPHESAVLEVESQTRGFLPVSNLSKVFLIVHLLFKIKIAKN